MAHFFDALAEEVRAKNSRVCVGLDPRPERMPPEFRRRMERDIERTAKAVLDFHVALIEVVKPHCVAVKLQAAFFERLGPFGAPLFLATAREAKLQGLLVIADVKRADIGEVSEAYAEAYFDAYGADAVTVNPYLGKDGVAPFIERARNLGKGLFVLVRTTNPSSGDLQMLQVEGEPLYVRVAGLVREWGAGTEGKCGYGVAGAVVSARHPEEASVLRAKLPSSWFLVPGFGAQGGTGASVKACFDKAGLGAVVNASRSIAHAFEEPEYRQKYGEQNWERATDEAVRAMRDEINRALS